MTNSIVRTIGFILVGMLALYGGVSIFSNATRALGAAPSAASRSADAQQAATGKSVPPYLNYQGTLRDPEGKPMSGLHKMTFRIYDDVTDPLPEALWTEEHDDVTVRDGQFSVLLGNNLPISPTIFSSPDLFIGVTVDPFDEMTPRQRFASVPFAMYADHASALTAPNGSNTHVVHVDEAGRVGVGVTSPQAQLHISATNPITSAMQVDAVGQQVLVNSNGIHLNGALYLNDASNENLILTSGGGRVGIGTNNPLAKLQVAGDTQVDGNVSMGGTDFVMLPNGRGDGGRAMVHGGNDSLVLNFGEDFSGGTAIGGPVVDVDGELHVGGHKPIFFQRFGDLGNPALDQDTGIPAADYNCGIAGWAVVGGDIQENNAGNYIAETFREDGFWKIKADFHWQDRPGSWYITLICVDTHLSEDHGGIP